MKMKKYTLLALGALLAMAGASANAAEMRSLDSSYGAGRATLSVEFGDDAAPTPTVFQADGGKLLVLDFPGVHTKLGTFSSNFRPTGAIASVEVAESEAVTRLTLKLTRSAAYQMKLDGSKLLVSVDDAPAVGTADSKRYDNTLQRGDRAATTALVSSDFKLMESGEGVLKLDVGSDDVSAAWAPREGSAYVVELIGASLPLLAARSVDLGSKQSALDSIELSERAGSVFVTIQPNSKLGASPIQLSQVGHVVEIHVQKPGELTAADKAATAPVANAGATAGAPAPADSAAKASTESAKDRVLGETETVRDLSRFNGKPMSLNFQDIEVRALLQVIADFTSLNIVASDTVAGSMTIRLKDVPWDQALDIVLQSRGLAMRKAGNVLWVSPRDEFIARDKAALESRKKLDELEPIITRAFQLNYAKAEDVAKGLKGGNIAGKSDGGGNEATVSSGANAQSEARILSTRGSVVAEQRTNQLFVSDIASKLDAVSKLIERVDVPVRQVLIEARIVEATDTFGRTLGAKLGVNDLRGQQGGVPGVSVGSGGTYVGIGGNYAAVGAQNKQNATYTYEDTQLVNLPALALGGVNPASVALSIFGPASNRFLNLELSALEADGKGKIVSSPRIVTANQVQASISQGSRVPFQKSAGQGTTAIEFIEASLKLDVTPQITPDGGVILTVKVNKDSLGQLTSLGREINIKEVRTQVLVQDGGTVVIGGIYEQTENVSNTKVPLLGDIPFAGNLFKSTTKDSQRTELLVFLTPRVVTDESPAR